MTYRFFLANLMTWFNKVVVHYLLFRCHRLHLIKLRGHGRHAVAATFHLPLHAP
jgi:hypothetical protein